MSHTACGSEQLCEATTSAFMLAKTGRLSHFSNIHVSCHIHIYMSLSTYTSHFSNIHVSFHMHIHIHMSPFTYACLFPMYRSLVTYTCLFLPVDISFHMYIDVSFQVYMSLSTRTYILLPAQQCLFPESTSLFSTVHVSLRMYMSNFKYISTCLFPREHLF